jgi:phosphoglycolate phosphatase
VKQIEWLNTQLNQREYRAALFDFDGTISLIREGWQSIMYSYFSDVLADVSPHESREQVEAVVRDFVDRLTGKQTIYQCIYLAEEVERRGGKSEDPLVYKQEYNRRLLKHIEHRVNALKSGQDREEFLVPGSMELLESLRERGVVLYLASGTDHEYVVEEATALGVSSYFNGGIFGALDDYENFSKEQVIRDLVLPEIASGEALLGFGDGYVEIENVKAAGGVAIGVASNEKDRQGIDAWKRDRLIQAGADVIIGDFRCRGPLLEKLFGGR